MFARNTATTIGYQTLDCWVVPEEHSKKPFGTIKEEEEQIC